MSLSNLVVSQKYSANGVTTAFAIPFAVIEDDSDETKVYLVDESTDPHTITLQTEGALQDYTLTGASPPSTPFATHVTFNSAPTSGLKVIVERVLDLTQGQELDANAGFPAAATELSLDRAMALIQQLDKKLQRAPTLARDTTKSDLLLPEPSAGLFLKWNSTEDGLENANPILNQAAGSVGLPATSTDNAIVRWDGTNADTVQDSGVTIDDSDNMLVPGTLAASNISGSNTGDQTIALTGDVTGTGTGSFAATIADDAVTNAKSANMAESTIKGRAVGAGTGDPTDLTPTQATAILDAFTGDSGAGGVKGLVPAPASGDAAANKFLKADGTWSAIAAGGGGALSWIERANSPAYDSANDLDNYIYGDGLTQYLYTQVRVPNSYVAGSQIRLRIPFYSSLNSGTVLMKTLATLIRSGVDPVTSTTNQRTSTNTAVTLGAGTVDEPQAVVCDLTDSSGQINSVAVSAGDIIKVRLTRDTSNDTAAGDVYALPYAAEVTFT